MEQQGPARTTVLRRIRHHLAWRRQRFDATTGTQLFLDPLHDPARALYVVSWPRSGSTWLAELLASSPGTRLVFEPANLAYEGRPELGTDLVSLPRVAPGGDLGGAGPRLEQAVTGRLRTHWSDQITTTRLARRRVVKDILGVGALPWIADRWPTMPVILLVRHPLAVAHSLVQLTWSMNNATSAQGFIDAHAPGADPSLAAAALLGELAQWADAHAAALGCDQAERTLVVFYEDLVTAPDEEIARLVRHVTEHGGRAWRTLSFDRRMVERPSFASFRRTSATTAERLEPWRHVYEPAVIDAAMEILAQRGLAGLYGPEATPLVPADRAAATVRSAREHLRGPE
jgi:hypothetical protein